jgi:hypothetical protein
MMTLTTKSHVQVSMINHQQPFAGHWVCRWATKTCWHASMACQHHGKV